MPPPVCCSDGSTWQDPRFAAISQAMSVNVLDSPVSASGWSVGSTTTLGMCCSAHPIGSQHACENQLCLRTSPAQAALHVLAPAAQASVPGYTRTLARFGLTNSLTTLDGVAGVGEKQLVQLVVVGKHALCAAHPAPDLCFGSSATRSSSRDGL